MTESHPIEPWLPRNARLLMCGTFPPQRKRWSMDFYYPNFINDMWRIFGIVFERDRDYFVDRQNRTFRLDAIKDMLLRCGIALSDTGRGVIREAGNASDKHLRIIEPIDLGGTLLKLPECRAVCTTGEKAAGVIAGITGTETPAMGTKVTCEITTENGVRRFDHWRMPSSSRAYPMKVEVKASYYAAMFAGLGIDVKPIINQKEK